jgi:hypothetical protein
MEDWYKISTQIFYNNFGGGMLEKVNGSPVDAVMNTFKDHTWQKWKFESPQSNSSNLHLSDFLEYLTKEEKGKREEREERERERGEGREERKRENRREMLEIHSGTPVGE